MSREENVAQIVQIVQKFARHFLPTTFLRLMCGAGDIHKIRPPKIAPPPHLYTQSTHFTMDSGDDYVQLLLNGSSHTLLTERFLFFTILSYFGQFLVVYLVFTCFHFLGFNFPNESYFIIFYQFAKVK